MTRLTVLKCNMMQSNSKTDNAVVSFKSNSRSAGQGKPRHLCNLKVNYRVPKSQPLVRILSHTNPINTLISYFNWLLYSYLCKHVPWYAQIFHPGIEGSDTNMLHATSSGCFNLAPYVTTFNVENSYGIPQINYEHSFTNGLIKCSNSSYPVVLHNRVLGLGASSAPIKHLIKALLNLTKKTKSI
jgi:hypothetical protein